MKTKISKTFAALFFLLFINANTHAQTVPFVNNLSCKVVVGYELRDPSCGVCDFGQITLLANSTTMYTVNAACSSFAEGCFWVISINGVPVATNHISYNICCSIPVTLSGADPSGCSSSGNYSVINSYPTSWIINP